MSGRLESVVSDRMAPTEADAGRLLGAYDRLRRRIHRATAGRTGDATADALLLVPDVFILLARLTLDRDVPSSSRRLLGGALVYFLVPIDLFPEAFAGPVGYVDDLVIACAVLGEAFGPDLETFTDSHWSGSKQLATVLGDVGRTADALLGANLWERVRRFLKKRGVRA